jgi:hypothetical protein
VSPACGLTRSYLTPDSDRDDRLRITQILDRDCLGVERSPDVALTVLFENERRAYHYLIPSAPLDPQKPNHRLNYINGECPPVWRACRASEVGLFTCFSLGLSSSRSIYTLRIQYISINRREHPIIGLLSFSLWKDCLDRPTGTVVWPRPEGSDRNSIPCSEGRASM